MACTFTYDSKTISDLNIFIEQYIHTYIITYFITNGTAKCFFYIQIMPTHQKLLIHNTKNIQHIKTLIYIYMLVMIFKLKVQSLSYYLPDRVITADQAGNMGHPVANLLRMIHKSRSNCLHYTICAYKLYWLFQTLANIVANDNGSRSLHTYACFCLYN